MYKSETTNVVSTCFSITEHLLDRVHLLELLFVLFRGTLCRSSQTSRVICWGSVLCGCGQFSHCLYETGRCCERVDWPSCRRREEFARVTVYRYVVPVSRLSLSVFSTFACLPSITDSPVVLTFVSFVSARLVSFWDSCLLLIRVLRIPNPLPFRSHSSPLNPRPGAGEVICQGVGLVFLVLSESEVYVRCPSTSAAVCRVATALTPRQVVAG